MDGPCEGGSPHLFSCIDSISNIVLGNRKMPTEDSQYIAPLLQELKVAYGNPIALMHDMGGAILKAVLEVFPGIPDYICHFHFLRDLGKDLFEFEFEYRTIQRYIRSFRVRPKLRNVLKQLKADIENDQVMAKSLNDYLKSKNKACLESALDPTVAAYLLAAWILESSSASNGFGFPFDRPHLDFYLRLQEAYPALKRLKKKGVCVLPLAVLSRTLTDAALLKLMIADTPLVKNLSNPDYLAILLNGHESLAKRFSAIDIELVRDEEQQNDKKFRQYPKGMRKIFKIPHLPQMLVKMPTK